MQKVGFFCKLFFFFAGELPSVFEDECADQKAGFLVFVQLSQFLQDESVKGMRVNQNLPRTRFLQFKGLKTQGFGNR